MALVVGEGTTLTELLQEIDRLNTQAILMREMGEQSSPEYHALHIRLNDLMAHMKARR